MTESSIVGGSPALGESARTIVRERGVKGFTYSASSYVYWKLWKFWMRLRLTGRKSLIRLGARPSTFKFDGREHRYFWHDYNLTWLNERTVEVPLVWKHLEERRGSRILEVGNVLSHYFPISHEVIDKYEKAPGVINEDIVSFLPVGKSYDLIVSISTLEHVGWDEKPREPEKLGRAIENLRGLLAPGGLLVFTVPIGYNEFLDAQLRDGRLKFGSKRFLRRTTKGNLWAELGDDRIPDAEYGSPFPFANVVMVASERKTG